jgi:excisionase family DNA binding protein
MAKGAQRGVVNSPSMNGCPPAQHAELCPDLTKPGSPPAVHGTAQRDNTDAVVRDDNRGFVSLGSKPATPMEPTDGALPVLVDIQAVARSLGISMRQVRRFVAEGQIPFVRVGHLIRFDPDELNDWINARRAGPTRPL